MNKSVHIIFYKSNTDPEAQNLTFGPNSIYAKIAFRSTYFFYFFDLNNYYIYKY